MIFHSCGHRRAQQAHLSPRCCFIKMETTQKEEQSFLSLSLSFCMYLQLLLKSLLYSDVFTINYTIWDHHTQTYTAVFLSTDEDFICLSDSSQALCMPHLKFFNKTNLVLIPYQGKFNFCVFLH